MKIELGKTPSTNDVKLPLFMLAIRKKSGGQNLFHVGRLYRGYVGIMLTIKNLLTLDMWVYNMESDND